MKKLMVIHLLMLLILGLSTNCNKLEVDVSKGNTSMGGDYYVATWGNDMNPGTYEKPFATLQRAIDVSRPGDTTYIRGGVYHITTPQRINPFRRDGTAVSGTAENPIHYFNYPGEEPIFDASGNESLYPTGISMHRVQYIKFRGITVRNVFQNTIHRDPAKIPRGWASTESANLTFERCTAHDIHGRGWQHFSGAWNEWDKPEKAPFEYDNTKWINCDAYDLYDPLSATPGNAADGWLVFSYQYNEFTWIGCRAWNYSDDGVDVFGAGYRYFYNCWMMSTDKYAYLSHSEGNGFKNWAPKESKFFPELLEDKVLVRYVNCIAALNTSAEIVNNNMWQERHNSRPNNALFLNNLTFGNYAGISCWSRGGWSPSVFINNISWGSTWAAYGFDPYLEVAIYRVLYEEENNTWKPTGGWPGWVYNDNFTLEDAAFASLDSLTIIREMTAPRKEDGSLPDITWARLVADSDMKGAGSNVGMSENPDIGIDWDDLDRTQGRPFFNLP